MLIWVFEYYALLLFFFKSCLAVMAKNNPTEKQIDVEIQATLKHGPAWKLTEECKVYRYKIVKIDLNVTYNYLHPNIRSSHLEVFLEKGVLENFAKFTRKHLCQSLVFTWIIFCYFKGFRCWLWTWITNVAVQFLEIPYLGNKYLFKVSNRNPKRRCEIC